jgi:hypothetical protein
MDEIDRAQERTDQFIANALHQRALAPVLPEPTGYCFNCQEPVHVGERYCDCDCRDDWQHRMSHRRTA